MSVGISELMYKMLESLVQLHTQIKLVEKTLTLRTSLLIIMDTPMTMKADEFTAKILQSFGKKTPNIFSFGHCYPMQYLFIIEVCGPYVCV